MYIQPLLPLQTGVFQASGICAQLPCAQPTRLEPAICQSDLPNSAK